MPNHSQLDPTLWEDQNKLQPEVLAGLLKIAREFWNTVDKTGKIKIVDVQLTGSTANYNYTPYSDIDLHIIVDFDVLECPGLDVKEFFLSKRQLWKNVHEIVIHNRPVEVYVEDVNEPAHTSRYSLLKESWVRHPEKISGEKTDKNIEKPLKVWQKLIKKSLKTDNLTLIKSVKDLLMDYRKSGLSTVDQEFSIPNLVFKELRNQKLLQALIDSVNQLTDQELSVPEESTQLSEATNIDIRIINWLQDRGYDYIGAGQDQMVYTSPNNPKIVLKVSGYPRRGAGPAGTAHSFEQKLNRHQKMLKDWEEYTQQHRSNPHYPKYRASESRYLFGRWYLFQWQEKFNRLSAEVEDQLEILADPELIKLSTKEYLEDGNIESAMFKLSQLVGKEQTYSIIRTMRNLYRDTQRYGYLWDLAGLNFMGKSDGTIIIVDPWVTDVFQEPKMFDEGFRDHNNEIVNPWELSESDQKLIKDNTDAELDESSFVSPQLHRWLRRNKGYTLLGRGKDQVAYGTPGGKYVLKIFGYNKYGTSGSKEISYDQAAALDWADYCRKNQNDIHLPKFRSSKPVEYQGRMYIFQWQERLLENSEEVYDLLYHLSDERKLRYSFDEYSTYPPVVESMNQLKELIGVKQIEGLDKTIWKLYHQTKKYRYSWDLYRNNFMRRDDGTIVAVDPWDVTSDVFNMFEGFRDPKIQQYLTRDRKQPYQHIGSGLDADVYSKNPSRVIKIIGYNMTDNSRVRMPKVQRMMLDWEAFAKENQQNPFFPKFRRSARAFEYADGVYLAQWQEKLENYPVLLQLMFEQFFDEFEDNSAIIGTYGADFYLDQRMNLDLKSELEKFLGQEKLKQLVNTLSTIYEEGASKGYRWDLHGSNVMYRGSTGNPVIVDPWVARAVMNSRG